MMMLNFLVGVIVREKIDHVSLKEHLRSSVPKRGEVLFPHKCVAHKFQAFLSRKSNLTNTFENIHMTLFLIHVVCSFSSVNKLL